MVVGYFYWWYTDGIFQGARIAYYYVSKIADFFSLETLVKTWVAPWKDDRLAADSASLSDQVKILELNFASRLVGFIVRTIVIIAAVLVVAVVAIVTIFLLGAWILLPFSWIIFPGLAAILVTQ